MSAPRLIYLLDDNADYRFLVQQVFKLFLPQHQIRMFADGAELVDQMDLLAEQNTTRPAVILLDIDMPRLNGFETLMRLKKHPYWQVVPVVMMTNRDQDEYRQESFRLEASAFIIKPLDLMDIKKVMIQLCEHQGDFTSLTVEKGNT